jgi:hypothetical protein
MSQARIRTPLELPRLSRLKAPLAGRLKPADRWARLALVALLAAGFVLAAACGAAPRNVGALKPGAQPQPGTLAGEVGRGEPADAQHDAAGQTAQLSGIAPADKSAAPAAAAPRAAGNAGANASAAAPQQPLPPLPSIDRMIVKSGTLTLQVTDLVEAMQQVSSVVAGIPGAYVAASSTTYRAEPTPTAVPLGPQPRSPEPIAPPRPVPAPGQSATVTLKVPADSFGDALQRLRALGTPLAEHVTTQEVTEEYVDLEAQVRNLEATEQQYLRFLERAQRIEEILPLQQRLTEVRSQIERLRGRMNLLQRRADQSTITVTLVPPSRADQRPGPEPRVVRTLREAFASLGVLLQGFLDVAIYAAVYALPLLPLAAAYVWWRRMRRRPAASAGGAM